MNDRLISLQHLGYSTGIVRRISNKRVLQRTAHNGRYIKLCMKHDDGSYKNVKFDGLICRTFIGPTSSDNLEVIHLNGDTLD